jgi:hypothetical protein
MAGIIPNPSNILTLIASLYPAFIVSFLVLASIFNLNLTGVFYILGLFITWVISMFFGIEMFAKVYQPPDKDEINPSCDLFNLTNWKNRRPNFQAAISGFTFMYLLLPTLPVVRTLSMPNWGVIIATAFFGLINIFHQKIRKCSTVLELVGGMVLGLGAGTGWFFLMHAANPKNVFYNEILSNNVICSKPARSTFKCSVYKGSKLISSANI